MTIHGTTVLVQRVNNVAKHAGMRFLDLTVGAERSLAVSVMREAEMLDASRLIEAIRKFYYTDVSAILLLILFTVFVIDAGTQQLRHGLLGREDSR